MIYKRCGRCGKRLTASSKCECIKSRNKEYDSFTRDTKSDRFYHSQEWIDKREDRKNHFGGIDIYSYYVLGVIEYGRAVHHIIPLKDDWSRRLDNSNLIYLSEKNHQELHKRMENGEKQEIIALLQDLLKKFEKEFNGEGVGAV